MAQLGVRGEEKILIFKYISGLASYIKKEMEFLTIGTLVKAYHSTIKIEEKMKLKGRCLTKPIVQPIETKNYVIVEFGKLK